MAEFTEIISPGRQAASRSVVDNSPRKRMAGTMGGEDGFDPVGRNQAVGVQECHDRRPGQGKGQVAGAATVKPAGVMDQPDFGKPLGYQVRSPIIGAVYQQHLKGMFRLLGAQGFKAIGNAVSSIITGNNDAQVERPRLGRSVVLGAFLHLEQERPPSTRTHHSYGRVRLLR